MERLTDNIDYCFMSCVEKEEDKSMIHEKCPAYNNCQDRLVWERLKVYEDAEEQGLLLRLPCRVGDTLWCIDNKEIESFVVKEFIICAYKIDRVEIYFEDASGFGLCLFDGTLVEGWFCTQAEAEEALREMKGGAE